MKGRKKFFFILFTIIVCIVSDQITKEIIKSQLPRTKPLTLARGMLSLDYVENKGGVFAME